MASPKVEIYTWSRCPFCIRAKALLDRKEIEYVEYCIDGDDDARVLMAQRANGRSSLPQVFIHDQPIGGCDELYGLEYQSKLDAMLSVKTEKQLDFG